MSKKRLVRKGPLPVRTRIWRKGDQPRVEHILDGRWVTCQNLAAARAYAREHGYAGIRVTPV